MPSLTLRHRVGEDGILHLDVPIGLNDAELEVTITFKKVTPVTMISEDLEWKEFIARTYGSCADDPIIIDDEGISEPLDEKMEGVFE